MAEDIWDELWRRWDKGEVDPFALVTCFPDFIKKIRAEGDKLQKQIELNLEVIRLQNNEIKMLRENLPEIKEKAEKYDAHEWVEKVSPEGVTLELYHLDNLATAHDDKRKAERKLEAARAWVGRQPEYGEGGLEELEKILGAEE